MCGFKKKQHSCVLSLEKAQPVLVAVCSIPVDARVAGHFAVSEQSHEEK